MWNLLRRPVPCAAALFVFAAALRVAFVVATADRGGPFSAFYQGDTAVWLAYAAAVRNGVPFAAELGLPLRPPGTAWLIALVWDGTSGGLGTLRIVWALLGAVWAPLTLWAARPLGATVAIGAAGLVAIATGAIELAASPGSEVPYGVLALVGLALASSVRARPRLPVAVAFGAVHALACLFRAEHLLVFAGLGAWSVGGWIRASGLDRRQALRAGVAIAVAALATWAPWHVHAFAAVASYNATDAPALPPRTLAWDAAAEAELAAEPGFARAATQRFVEAVTRHRGGSQVGAAEIAALDEAFGFRPRPLPERFFVAVYGPLNFALANGPEADGGFSRAALQRAPLLTGGAARYPADWLASLPGSDVLVLQYPPHLRLVLDGYRLGGQWALDHPAAFVALAARKLAIAWGGIAHGLGGHALPLGASGVRRRVDLTVPDGGLADAWRIGWLALVGVGLVRARGRPGVGPWLVWIASAVIVTMMFFGYARQGATVVPAFAVLVGLALEPFARRWPGRARVACVGLLIVVGIGELMRGLAPPTLFVDGASVQGVEPWPPTQYENRRVEAR